MGFILRQIFYTLLPRSKKARLIVLVVCLALWIVVAPIVTMIAYVSPAYASIPSGSSGVCSDPLPSDYIQKIQSQHSAFDPDTYSWVIMGGGGTVEILYNDTVQITGDSHDPGTNQFINLDSGSPRGVIRFAYSGTTWSSPEHYTETPYWSAWYKSCVFMAHDINYTSSWSGDHAPEYGQATPPPDPVDQCNNIDGIQESIPDPSMYRDSSGNCYERCPYVGHELPRDDPTCVDPSTTPPTVPTEISFQQKMGIGIASVVGGFVIYMFRYRGEA